MRNYIRICFINLHSSSIHLPGGITHKYKNNVITHKYKYNVSLKRYIDTYFFDLAVTCPIGDKWNRGNIR